MGLGTSSYHIVSKVRPPGSPGCGVCLLGGRIHRNCLEFFCTGDLPVPSLNVLFRIILKLFRKSLCSLC